jgi:hypothetical protein
VAGRRVSLTKGIFEIVMTLECDAVRCEGHTQMRVRMSVDRVK